MKDMATSNDPVTFWGYELDQSDHKCHLDLLGNKVGHGDFLGFPYRLNSSSFLFFLYSHLRGAISPSFLD